MQLRMPLALSACLAGFMILASPTCAQTVAPVLQLSQNEVLALVETQLISGRADLALKLVDGLLATRPDVYPAHLIRIDALRRLGRTDAALRAARAAWRAAPNASERTRVARLASVEAYKDGKTFQSKLWLRRASNTADTPAQKRGIARNFNEIRRYDPWTTNFSFSISPSSNVNNGAQGDVYSVDGSPWIGTVDAQSQALSGYRISASAAARHRWEKARGLSLYTGVSISNTLVKLSSTAKTDAPDAVETDYDFGRISLEFGGTKAIGKRHAVAWDIAAGRVFSGRAPYSDTLSATITDIRALTNGSVIRNSLEARGTFAVSPDRADAHSLRYSVGLTPAKTARGSFNHAAYVERVFSDASTLARDSYGVSTKFTAANPVFGTQAYFAIGAEFSRYETYPFVNTPVTRSDKTLFGVASFTFTDQAIYGFAPELKINFGQTWSNMSRFDTRTTAIGLGIKSAF
ncbi:hypothetical protein SAMN05444421_10474 [Celeribacter marinus]|uniref:Uncharacterized protein n=2 Tax=Celeribacter marinus TaxID=1397108 RepID=A0A0P0ACD3_9RHOB|nr:hypothetical protein IMCC12053_2536 [Celeribacter marinus]SFK41980.1 hypothetical protein SAMN05444421_10474 [Celeribacter marinus]